MSSHGVFVSATENSPSISPSTPHGADKKNAKKMAHSKENNNLSSSSPQHRGHKKASRSSFPLDQSDSSVHCFICTSKRSTASNPILCGSICHCTGSFSAVHQRCIDELVLKHGYSTCTICGQPYHIQFPPDMYRFLLLRTWVKWKKIAYATFCSPKGVHPLVTRVAKWLWWVWFSYILVPYAVGAVYYREVLSSMEIEPSFLMIPTTTSLAATHQPTTSAGVPVTVSEMRWNCFSSWVLGSVVGIGIRLIWLGWLWWKRNVIPNKVRASVASHTSPKRTTKANTRKKEEGKAEKMASSASHDRHGVTNTTRRRTGSSNTNEESAGRLSDENAEDWSDTDFEDEPEGARETKESCEDREEEEEEEEEEEGTDDDDGEQRENVDLDVLNEVSIRVVGTAELVRPIQSFLSVLSALEKFTMYTDIAYITMAHLLLGSLFLWICSASFFLQCTCWLLFLAGVWWLHAHYATKKETNHAFAMKELAKLKPHITYREYVVFYILIVFRAIVTFGTLTLTLFCVHIAISPFLSFSFRGAPTMHLPQTSAEVLSPLSPASTTIADVSSSSSFSPGSFASTAAPWDTVMKQFNIFRGLLYLFSAFLLLFANHAIDSNVMYYLFTCGVNLFLFHPLYVDENTEPPDEDHLLLVALNQSFSFLFRVVILSVILFFSLVLFLLLPLGTCMSIRYTLWGDQLTAPWLAPSVNQRLTVGARVERNTTLPFSLKPWRQSEHIASSPTSVKGEENAHDWPFSSALVATSRSSFIFYDHALCPLVSFLMTTFTHTLARLPLFTPLPSLGVTAVGSSTGDPLVSSFASSSPSMVEREGAAQGEAGEEEKRNHHSTAKKNRHSIIVLPLSLDKQRSRNRIVRRRRSEGQAKISPFVREWVYKLLKGPVSAEWGFLAREDAETNNQTSFYDNKGRDAVWNQHEEVRKKVLSILRANDEENTKRIARKAERKAPTANFVQRFFQKVVARIAFIRQKTQAGRMCSTLWASVVRDSLSSSEILPISILSLFDVVEGTNLSFPTASSPASFLPVVLGDEEKEDHQEVTQTFTFAPLGSEGHTCSSTSSSEKNLFFSVISPSSTTSTSLSMLMAPQSLGIPCASVTMVFVGYWTTKLIQHGEALMDSAFGIVQQSVWNTAGKTRKPKRSPRVFLKSVISWVLLVLTFPLRKGWWWMARAWTNHSVMRMVGNELWIVVGGLTTLRFLCGKTYYVHWMYYLLRAARFWGNVWGLSSYLFMEDTHTFLELYIDLVNEREKNWSLDDLFNEYIPFDAPQPSVDWQAVRRTDIMKKEDIPSYITLRLHAFYWCFFISAVMLFWELPIIGSVFGVSWTTELIPLLLLSTWLIAAHNYSSSFLRSFLSSLLAITALTAALVHIALQCLFQLVKVVLFGRLADAVYLYAVREHPHVSTIPKVKRKSHKK